ncbi:MAG: ABC transporter permease [Candidatus Eisenbacteria bacterium]
MRGRRRLDEKKRWRLAPLAILFTLLAIGEGASRSGLIPALFFPAPTTVLATILRLVESGEMGTHIGATLGRVLAGVLLGGVPGVLFGWIMGWSRPLRRLLDPFVAAAHPIPKISIFPLVLIIFGIGAFSKVLVVAIAVFFPLLINTMTGVRQIHPIYFEVANNYGAGRRKTFFRVVVPGSLPLVMAGLRIALNVALTLTIAVELITAQEGLGAMIWLSWQTLRTENLYAGIVMTALLGIGFRYLVHYMTVRFVPWQTEASH